PDHSPRIFLKRSVKLAVELFRTLEPPGSAAACEYVAFEVLCDSVVAIGKDQALAPSPADACGIVEAFVGKELEGFKGVSGPAPAVFPGLDADHFSAHDASMHSLQFPSRSLTAGTRLFAMRVKR